MVLSVLEKTLLFFTIITNPLILHFHAGIFFFLFGCVRPLRVRSLLQGGQGWYSVFILRVADTGDFYFFFAKD